MPFMPRVLLIGLDGAEPSLAQRWMDEGRLPHLAALRNSGAFMPCHSTTPPVTYPAWTTCITGMNPGRHGIFDFTEVIPGTYRLRFVNSADREAPALWNLLSAAGKRVGVLGVPGTYPPEPVNGFMVSGFDSPVANSVDETCVYPDSLFPRVRAWRFADFQEERIGAGWHEFALASLLEKLDTKERIACDLLGEEPWDFFMVVFGESDTVSHHFWLFHDDQSPRHRPGPSHAIRQIYERLDTAVGRLMEQAGPETVTIVVSDHGFGGVGTGVVHLNNWLALQGYIRFRGGGGSLLKQTALKFAPVRMRGALFRKFKHLAASAESKSRFSGIDWENTLAWSEELNYFPSVRVNLAGREPRGQVQKSDYADIVRDLCAHLESWHVVHRAWPRDQVFEGPWLERAPDIVLELGTEQGYAYSCLRGRGGAPFRRIASDEYFGGKERGMTGSHRPAGVCLTSEPCSAASCRLQDIAPTVLALLGVPAPPMDGKSLFHKTEPAPPAPFPRPLYSMTQEEECIVEERLRALGYLE